MRNPSAPGVIHSCLPSPTTHPEGSYQMLLVVLYTSGFICYLLLSNILKRRDANYEKGDHSGARYVGLTYAPVYGQHTPTHIK